jgi:asparagine synthase (glutamine-hydrolysing)
MCGLAGLMNLRGEAPVSRSLLIRMLSSLSHRGPDESGIYLDRQVGLGHARLSIIGVDDGMQPMANEDEGLWIIFNGEAFNYLELRRDLEKSGHRFATATDTEVVLHLYEEFGPSCLQRINGQFALAIWDARRQELFLARDRVGVRPLYLAQTAEQIVFASEIKALFQHPEVSRELDPESLEQALTYWHPLSPRTAFRAVRELRPGHWLRIREGRLEEQAWWSLPYYPPEACWSGTFAEACEEVAALLHDAVRLRLRADVPVGAYLSGGLDSTILTALAKASRGAAGLSTFSLAFQEKEFDESVFQEEAARLLGTEHRTLPLSGAQIREHFPAVVWHCEQPLLRTAPVPLFLLSRLVQESAFKVVLTGEGADEVFGGYDIFKEAKVRRYWAREPTSRRRPLLLERLYPYIFSDPGRGRHFLQQFYAIRAGDAEDPFLSHRLRWQNGRRNLAVLSPALRDAIAERPTSVLDGLLPDDFAGRDWLSRAQFLEIATFLSGFLLSAQGDRVAMAHSLELRHPFLDWRVIDFGCRLPSHWKIRGLNEKYLLKQAFSGRIPETVRRRSKQPYRAPIRQVFGRGGPETLTDHVLSDSYLRQAGLFDPARAGHLLARYKMAEAGTGNENQQMAVTAIASVQLLHYQFVAGRFLQPIIRPPDRLFEPADRGLRQNAS